VRLDIRNPLIRGALDRAFFPELVAAGRGVSGCRHVREDSPETGAEADGAVHTATLRVAARRRNIPRLEDCHEFRQEG